MALAQIAPRKEIDLALTRRLQDEGHTRTIEGFLDTVYYNAPSPWDPTKRLSDHLCRNETNAARQKEGADIDIEDTPYGQIIGDEKFAINYRLSDQNDPDYKGDLKSYSFELETCVRSDNGWTPQPGWFVNPDNKTTHYMLLWFKSDRDISTIEQYDCCMISKEIIKEKLAEEGIDFNRMAQTLKDYTERGIEPPDEYSLVPGKNIGIAYKGYKVTQSLQFDERPVNLIIPKNKLMGWSAEMTKEWIMQSTADADNQKKRIEQFQVAMSSETPIKIQEAIRQMEAQQQQKTQQIDYSKYVTPGTAKLLAERGLASGTIYYEHNKRTSQGSIKRAIPGDRLLVMANGEKVPIAELKGDKWHALTYPSAIDRIAGKTITPMNEMATKARIEARAREEMVRDLQNRSGMPFKQWIKTTSH